MGSEQVTASDAAADALARAEQAWRQQALAPGVEAAAQAWALAAMPVPPAEATDTTNAEAWRRQARAGLLLAQFHYRLGQFEALLAVGDSIVAAIRAAGQPDQACQVLRWMALGGAEISAFDRAIDAARRGLALAGRIGSASLQVLLTNALAAGFERMGDPWQAERLLRDALALAQREGGDVERFVTHNNLCAVGLTAYYLLRDGDTPAEAIEQLRQARVDAMLALPLAERIGDPFYSVYIHANTGDALTFLGEHEAGHDHLQRALALAQQHRFETQVWRVRCSLGELALERGRAGAARDELQPLAREMGTRAPLVTSMRCQHALYRALRQLGQTEQALVCFERFQAMDRRRVVSQLKAQAHNLVTRAEIEQAHRDARYHREQAATLAEEAARDALTGLANRRGLEQRLRALRAATGDAPLAVAVLDIDSFKAINDQQGHAVGDAVLGQMARLLLSHVRHRDIVARLGGDEFVLVLPDADAAQAAAVLERIRQSAQQESPQAADAPPPFRFSAGVTVMPAAWDGRQPLGEWLADADDALYAGKRGGGDSITVRERS